MLKTESLKKVVKNSVTLTAKTPHKTPLIFDI